MDPRVVPEDFVGPKPLIAVFRNAGGRATPDVVRTISVFRSLTKKAETASVMVVHHTGECGPQKHCLPSLTDLARRLWHDAPHERGHQGGYTQQEC